MNLFGQIKNVFRKNTSSSSGLKGEHFDFSSWANKIFGGMSNNSLATNETIFSVITRLSNTVSSLPVHLYQNYEQSSNAVGKLINYQANPSMSAFELLNRLETSRNADGNGYALIERDRLGNPVNLWPIKSSAVSPVINRDDLSLWYMVTDEYVQAVVYNTEMIHVKHISPLGMIEGLSPIKVLKNSLDFEKAIESFSLSEMDKKDSYVIKQDRSSSDKKAENTVQAFLSMIRNNGGAVLLDKGLDADRFESQFQTSDLKTAESITRARIANAFNVPITFLNESNSSGVSSNEQLMTQFVQMTLLPIIKQYEAEFNRKLLSQSQQDAGFYFKFNVNGLLRGDTASRTNFYQVMIRNGIATPNDLRKLEEMSPIQDDSANKLYITGDIYPLDTEVSERNGSSSDSTDSAVMTINERRAEDGLPAIKGGDAIYMSSSNIPQIDVNDSDDSSSSSGNETKKGGGM